jgi:hypothetical protein
VAAVAHIAAIAKKFRMFVMLVDPPLPIGAQH